MLESSKLLKFEDKKINSLSKIVSGKKIETGGGTIGCGDKQQCYDSDVTRTRWIFPDKTTYIDVGDC